MDIDATAAEETNAEDTGIPDGSRLETRQNGIRTCESERCLQPAEITIIRSLRESHEYQIFYKGLWSYPRTLEAAHYHIYFRSNLR